MHAADHCAQTPFEIQSLKTLCSAVLPEVYDKRMEFASDWKRSDLLKKNCCVMRKLCVAVALPIDTIHNNWHSYEGGKIVPNLSVVWHHC
jgi:hypothetical protein